MQVSVLRGGVLETSTLRIAWRNLGRNRRRSALAIGAVALGQFTLVALGAHRAASVRTIDQLLDKIGRPPWAMQIVGG